MITGTVLAVTAEPYGDQLTEAVAPGAGSLTVYDAADFTERGGTLHIGAETHSYTAADPDTGVITLTGTLASGYDADTDVEVWDVALGVPLTDYTALVELPGELDTDAISATVAHALIPLLAEGIREPGQGEAVGLDSGPSGYVVANIIGKLPQLQGALIQAASIAPEALSFTVGTTTVTVGTEPAAPNTGDLWIDTATDNQTKMWDGDSWELIQYGTGALAADSVTADILAANAVVAGKIAVGALDAMTINAGALTSGSISAGSIGSTMIVASQIIFDSVDGGALLVYGRTGEQTVELTDVGTHTWQVPAGVTVLNRVEAWGGGAGGSASFLRAGSPAQYVTGQGGGGGEYARAEQITVTPLENLSYTIGAGGAGGTTAPNDYPGRSGEETIFGADVVHAYPGVSRQGGAASSNATHFAGGMGGDAWGSTSPITNRGGSGGGSSASPVANGSNGATATNQLGGAAGQISDGGDGGQGGSYLTAGLDASAPGGGGGGGGITYSGSTPVYHDGGDGAPGKIRVSYGGAVELIAAVTGNAGEDAYGNTYPAGISGQIRGRTGVVEMTAGATLPDGALWCDGSSLLRSAYPALFTEIGTTYGAVDGTHFTLPNMGGRFPRGNTRGVGGGADTHTHTSAAHTHDVATPAHTHALDTNGQARIFISASSTPALFMQRVATAAYTSSHQLNGPSGGGSTQAGGTGAALIGRTADLYSDVGGTTDSTTPGDTGSSSNVPANTGLAFYIWT